MESREIILGKLRATRRRGVLGERPIFGAAEIFADIPSAERSVMFEQFARKLTALKGEVYRVATLNEAAQRIAQLAQESGFIRCGRQRAPLLERLFKGSAELSFLEDQMIVVESIGESERIMDSSVVRAGCTDSSAELSHAVVERMQCAFSAADALIARTGSIALRATTAGGRRLSVLPPVHCVVATSEQLTPCLSSWLASAHSDPSWSYGTIITGPSRTADIERILVLGAHGPKRLIVVVIDEPNKMN